MEDYHSRTPIVNLDGFKKVGRGYRARCPAHSGQSTTSLSIWFDGDRTRLFCWAGCSYADIKEAIGLGLNALPRSRDVPSFPTPIATALADVATRDRVYQSLLSQLSLNPEHHENLLARGLSDAHIRSGMYRSLPLRGRSAIAQRLVEQFGPQICGTIPGLVQKEGSSGRGAYWSLSGGPGLMIPQRDVKGRIVALLLRPNDSSYGKYMAFTSSKYDGPSPGSNCHVPTFMPITSGAEVRISEGALKADVATALSGILTLGIPGVSPWHTALPILEELQPKTVLLAWDADWRRNAAVASSVADAALELTQKQGFQVQFEYWDPHAGKGIDDVFLAGHTPERRHWTYALAARTRGLSGTKTPKAGGWRRG